MIDRRGKLPSKPDNKISKIKSPFVPQDNPIIIGDSVQIAFEKTQGQINNLAKSQVSLGNWNALTNTPILPLTPANPTYKSGEYYNVLVSGIFNGVQYTVGDKIVVSTNKATNTLFWELNNFDNETKQDKIFTYTVANLTALYAITGMIAGNTAKTLDTLKEYIYTTQWEEVFETLANKNQPNGYAGLDSDNSVYASQLEKPILNFLPRAFYGFEIAGGVATFDNATNTINKNDLLLCTASDGSLTFNKGTLYQIDTTTATPTTAMLSSHLTPAQMVGKQLILHRDFNNYPKGSYTANDTETDLIRLDTNVFAEVTELQEKLTGLQDNLKIVGFVNKSDTTLSWNDANRTVTLNIDNATQIYINGKLYDLPIGIFTKQISNVEGQHYIYFDVDVNNNVIIEETTSFTEDLITKYCIIAYCYFDATNSKAVLGLQDERHGMTMDCDTHLYLHNTIGTAYQSGLLPSVIADGDGSVDSHIQMAGASGIIEDEDLKHTIPSRASTDNITIIYRDGANGNWVEHSATNKIVIPAGTGRASYNQNNLGVWQLTEIANNDFGICYAFVCPSIDNSKKWFIILGTNSYSNVNNAREAASILPDLGVLPFKEYKLVAGFIYKTSNSYTNTVKSKIVSIDGISPFIDFRTSTSVQNAPINASDVVNLQNQINLKQNNIISVANQAAMLALTGKIVGDIVIREDDNNYLYRLTALPASNLSNWEVLGKDLLLNTEDKFEIGRRIAKQYSSELYDVTAYLKSLTYTNVSTEAQLLAAILVEGFVVKLTNNITLTSQINFAQKGVLHLNGFTINASVPTVVVNITKAVIISGGTLAHEKLTDTSVEALVKINTPANERAILHDLTLKHVEFGADLNGCWALQNVNFEYNTPFGTATDSHRHIAIKTVLGDCFIDNITFSGIPQVATTRYTNFILADITEWTGNLQIRNVKQSAVGALRQFLNFQTLGVNVTAGKLIVQDCNFNDLNGGIFFLTPGALDKMEYIVLTNNEQGGDAIGVFKGLLYFSFTGALGTKSKIIHYNNKTLAGALRADYVSLIPTADTANTGIVARQNTVTINAGQEYAVANKSIVDTFYQDFYRKGENDVALNTKQNITDNTLNTTSKTIVGGINELKISIDGKVVDEINDGVISTAPSQNAVFDALALKQKKVYHYTDTEANILLIDPTANNGKTAKATDTLKEYISNGTAWIEVSGGNSLTVGAVETANFTALANTINPVNTTAGVVIATLPSSPIAGDIVRFTDYANKFATNKLTLNPNGLKINSSTSNVDITTNNSDPTLTYIDATEGWALQVVASGGGGFSVTADTTTTTLDLNSLNTTGITNFSGVTSLTNGPTGIVPIAGKLLTVEDYVSTNGRIQDLLLNDNKYFRSYINSIWSSWQLIATVDTTPNSNIIDALATPPASPSNGDAYIMLANPTGAWSTFAQGTVTTYNESTASWVNTIPANGSAITFSNPVNLNSINSYYIAGQTYKYNSGWGSPVITGLLWQLYIASSQFQPYDSQAISLALASNVVTATCPQNHNLAVGYSIVISASPNAAFNETVTVTAIVSPTVFRYAKTLANTTTTASLKASTQLLPTACTSILMPSGISQNITIKVANGSYQTSSAPISATNDSSIYKLTIAELNIVKPKNSNLLTPNTTATWHPFNDSRYQVITHTLGATVQRLKSLKKLQTGSGFVLGNHTDRGSNTTTNRQCGLMLVIEVINSTQALVFDGSGKIQLPYVISSIYPNLTPANINLVGGDLFLNSTGDLVKTDLRPTDGDAIVVGEFINDNELDYRQQIVPITPNIITPIIQQVEGNKKQYVLTSGKKTGAYNNIMSIGTTNIANDSLVWDTIGVPMQGKFGGATQTLLSSASLIKKLATQIPVFGGTVVNPNLDPAIANINTQGAQNYIFAINPLGTIFAIPSPVATPNSKFVDAIGDISVLTAGQIGFQLNPLMPYRHNGTAIENYDFILLGQATWNGSVFNNVLNISFNGVHDTGWFAQGANTVSTKNHNIGSKRIKSYILGSTTGTDAGIEGPAQNYYGNPTYSGSDIGVITNNTYQYKTNNSAQVIWAGGSGVNDFIPVGFARIYTERIY